MATDHETLRQLKAAADCTQWLKTIYFSELCFLFHLPLFLTIESSSDIYKRPEKYEVSASDTGPATLWTTIANKTLKRINKLITKVQSFKTRVTKVWNNKHSKPIPWFQFSIFIVRCILNYVALILIFYDVKNAINLTEKDAEHRIFYTSTAKVGWYMILASFILYILSYFHQRYHLMQLFIKSTNSDTIHIVFPNKLYWLSQFSVINFSLDFPSAGIPSVTFNRFVVCAINIVAILTLTFVLFAVEPFTKAWGCYPSSDHYTDLNYGMCPAFFSGDQQHLQPVSAHVHM